MSVKTFETFEDYQEPEENSKIELSPGFGAFFNIKTKEGRKKLVKVLEKKDKFKDKIIENEKNASKISGFLSRFSTTVQSVVKDKEKAFLIYSRPMGEPLKNKLNDLEIDDKKAIARQFFMFLQQAEKRSIFILKDTPLENTFISKQKKINYVGFDCAYYSKVEKISEVVKKAKKLDIEHHPDLLTFACFLHQLLAEGKPLFDNKGKPAIDPSIDGDAKELIQNCLDDTKRKEGVDVLNSKLLEEHMEVKFEQEEKKLQIGQISLEWAEGLKLGIGSNSVGFNEGMLSINGGDTTLSLGQEGIKLEVEEEDEDEEEEETDEPKMEKTAHEIIEEAKEMHQEAVEELKSEVKNELLNAVGIKTEEKKKEKKTTTSAVTIGPGGLKMESGDDVTTVGPKGFETKASGTTTQINDQVGFSYTDAESHKLEFKSSFNCTLTEANIKKGLNTTVQSGKLFFSVGTAGIILIIGGSFIKVKKDLRFGSNGVEFIISTSGLEMKLGKNGSMTINTSGLTATLGDMIVSINGEGLSLEFCGFIITIGKGGFQFKNGNQPFDMKKSGVDFDFGKIDLGLKMPGIPSIPMPPLPTPKVKCNIF